MSFNIKKIETIDELNIKLEEDLKNEPKEQNWFQDMLDNITWEINWQYRDKIVHPWRSFWAGVDNLRRYRKIVWRDRWWDHSFFLGLILFKLKETEAHWGVDTHYINDTDEKEILKKMIEDLEWMVDEDKDDGSKKYNDEYKKRSRSFFGRFDRHHRKFWD